MASKVASYLAALQRSGLLDAATLAEHLDQFRKVFNIHHKTQIELEPLSAYLLEMGLVTPWQDEMLREGRHRGFFLGKYRLLAHLGSGGMSKVYLAEHLHMRRRVAIKVLPRELIDSRSYFQRFLLEARAAAAVDHPNIVHAYSVDNDGDVHYLVMQYIEGGDLQHRVMSQGPLDQITAAQFIQQSAEGLAHAHRKGLIHRDIKPANLMVDLQGVVKVMDLGLVRLSGTKDKSLTIEHHEQVLGTADYLAPEQALDSHAVDARCDIYALGCTLFFLLTGQPPFPDGSVAERLIKHQTEPPPPIRRFCPHLDPELEAILKKMMAKKRDERYSSAEEVSRTMQEWLHARGAVVKSPSSTVMPPTPQRVVEPAAPKPKPAGEGNWTTAPTQITGAAPPAKSPPEARPAGPRTPPGVPRTPPGVPQHSAAPNAAGLEDIARRLRGSDSSVIALEELFAASKSQKKKDSRTREGRTDGRKSDGRRTDSSVGPTPQLTRILMLISIGMLSTLGVAALVAVAFNAGSGSNDIVEVEVTSAPSTTAGPTGTLAIDFIPRERRGAKVFIDDIGMAVPDKGPVEFELPLGRHYVRVQRSGHAEFVAPIEIKPNDVRRISLNAARKE